MDGSEAVIGTAWGWLNARPPDDEQLLGIRSPGEDDSMQEPLAARRGFLQHHWPQLVTAAIWVSVVGTALLYLGRTGLTIPQALRQLIELLQTPAGPLLYLIAYALRPFTFLSATVLTLAGGAIFGPVWGLILTIIASNASATVAYVTGRLLGNGALERGQATSLIGRYAGRMRRNGFETTLTLRALFVPYDPVSYLAGLVGVGYPAFIVATILGSLPGTISFVLAGAAVPIEAIFDDTIRPSLNPWLLAVAAALFVASLAVARYLCGREGGRTSLANGPDAQRPAS